MLRIYQPDGPGPRPHAPAKPVRTIRSHSGRVSVSFLDDGNLVAEAAGRKTYLDAGELTAAGVWGFVKAIMDGEAVSEGRPSRR